MTTTEAVDPDVDGIIDRLEDIRLETGHDIGRVFRDWMALSVHAFEGNDEAYLERLDRYDRDELADDVHESVAQSFSEALGELVLATSESNRPVVGEVYERVGNQADDFGQYFTPWNVCVSKARMLITEADAEEATAEDPLTVADPACGSARLLVAAAKTLHHIDPSARILVSGTDKDRTCARMAVANLVIAGVPGRIRYGNSITMEMHRTWRVEPNGPGPAVRRVDPDDPGPADDDSTESESPTDDAGQQLELDGWST